MVPSTFLARVVLVAAVSALPLQARQEVHSRYVPNPGVTIGVTRSLLIATGEHILPPQGEQGVFRLEGQSGITLDLSGSSVRGAPAGADIDGLAGWGIVLVGCSDITVRGGTLGGYRGCIVARDCHALTIENVTFRGLVRSATAQHRCRRRPGRLAVAPRERRGAMARQLRRCYRGQ